jgi:uncharacterized membrane protein
MGYQPSWWEYLFFLGPSLLTGLAVFAGVYFGMRLALKHWSSRERNGYGATDPVDILRERYAKGQVSRSEYEKMREDLR